MNWLFDVLNLEQPALSEPLVDCNSCQLKKPLSRTGEYKVESKCCDFSPYWSLFAVGAWIEDGNSLSTLPGLRNNSLIVSKIGIMHTLEHRKTEGALCHHFDLKSQNCSIWRQRPPTCFSFFCASQYSVGLKQYGMLEDWMLSVEAAALQLYFKKEHLPEKTWELWSEYMELSPLNDSLPEGLAMTATNADLHFRESYLWLRDSNDCKVLREQVRDSWNHKFLNHPYF